MASKMLGIDAGSNGDEVQDAVGEVCNMVAGNFKNKIAGLGDGCQLSVPTVITGEDYCLRTLSNDRTVDSKFLFEGSVVIFSIRLNN
jgi:chemotaxis protein CheX